jgi:hypothetical protein
MAKRENRWSEISVNDTEATAQRGTHITGEKTFNVCKLASNDKKKDCTS